MSDTNHWRLVGIILKLAEEGSREDPSQPEPRKLYPASRCLAVVSNSEKKDQ